MCLGILASDLLELELQTYGYELPYGCWELNPGPLEEQPMLSTTGAPLHPHIGSLKTKI